jgi:hypothetical protein
MGLRARTARIMRDGSEMEVPVDEVRVGDMVLVRPAKRYRWMALWSKAVQPLMNRC